ncbi:MAG: hypothetical protein Fur0043_16350 [Anaerolineales bacterium]
MNEILALVILLVAAGLLLAFILLQRKTKPTFRDIAALTQLKRAIGLSVEDGTRLHVSLGWGGLQTAHGAAALAGLGLLRHLAEQTSVSDKPPVVTSGEGVISILTADTARSGYKAAGAEGLFDPATTRLSGLSPFSYAAGALPAIRDENVSLNIFIGHFGPEVALLTEAAERANALAIAAVDEPSAQAVLFASLEKPLIGEELFAAGAYAGADTAHQASLSTQDILRWLVIAALLAASALKLVGVF